MIAMDDINTSDAPATDTSGVPQQCRLSDSSAVCSTLSEVSQQPTQLLVLHSRLHTHYGSTTSHGNNKLAACGDDNRHIQETELCDDIAEQTLSGLATISGTAVQLHRTELREPLSVSEYFEDHTAAQDVGTGGAGSGYSRTGSHVDLHGSDVTDHKSITGIGINAANLRTVTNLYQADDALSGSMGRDNLGFIGDVEQKTEANKRHLYNRLRLQLIQEEPVRVRMLSHDPLALTPSVMMILAVVGCVLFLPLGVAAVFCTLLAQSQYDRGDTYSAANTASFSLALSITAIFIGIVIITCIVLYLTLPHYT